MPARPLLGGGAVALLAKAAGFRVVASDFAERGAIVARALIANSSTRLARSDVDRLFATPRAPSPPRAIALDPRPFTSRQAAFIDGALALAALRPEPVRSLLELVVVKLVLRMFPMSMPSATDAKHAAAGDFDRVSPRRVGHYSNAAQLITPLRLWSFAERVNAGVFGGAGECLKGDALDVIAETVADVVYLDPPYPGTTEYGPSYRILDTLLGDDTSAARTPALVELLRASAHVPLLVLSYGGPRVTLDELVAVVGEHRAVRKALAIPYPRLRALAKEETNARSCEYLIVAQRR